MGILNVTPDSFSDGGKWSDPERAAAHAAAMVAAGAAIVDVGAESTRPGATPVPPEVELARLRPVLRAVRQAVRVPLSVDTMKAAVARVALAEGADLVNDVSAGRFDAAMLRLCATERVPIVLMHMRGTPQTMQHAPRYRDVVATVVAFLRQRAAVARRAGIPRQAIVVDPGIGFGKTLQHNLRLLANLGTLVRLGYPVVVGVSRKGFIGQLCDRPDPASRDWGTAAAVALAVAHGARILRVHDVPAMRDVLAVATAVVDA